MAGLGEMLGSVVNGRTLLVVLALAVLVLLVGYTMAKNEKTRRKRPGQHLLYQCPGRTAAACRGLLENPAAGDLFAYKLESAPAGGWYITFQRHNPTQQILDTLFLLQFEGDDPARFSLAFKREAFGAREPVMPEAMLDEFFSQKLGAQRMEEQLDGE